MRHQKRTKKFKRTEEERKRLWIDLTQALILEGKVITFTARAKWFTPRFERLVTLCKRAKGDQKLAYSKVRPFLSEKVARKLIEEIVPKLEGRNGGYTRALKLDAHFNEHDKSVVEIVETITKTKSETKESPSSESTSIKSAETTFAKEVDKKEEEKTPTKKSSTKKTTNKESVKKKGSKETETAKKKTVAKSKKDTKETKFTK